MRVIVTRPKREAQRWVLDLSEAGFEAVALPLIKVGPVEDAAEVVKAWQHLNDYVGVMFVSGNAVEHFFASKPHLAPEFSAQAAIKTRAWATGPGTAKALLRESVAPGLIDAPSATTSQFDSEALWRVIGGQVQPGDKVLIVRGGDAADRASAGKGAGREWFANSVTLAGGQADFVVAYQRYAPYFSSHERELAHQASMDGSTVWLFSSTEAVTNLRTWLPEHDWSQARAVATHPRIAAAVKRAGFGVVRESRPTLLDVASTLNSLGPGAP